MSNLSKKRFEAQEVWKHLKNTLEVSLSAILLNNYLIRITDGSFTDDVSGENHQFTIKMTIQAQPRTQPLVVPEETPQKS
jgi:hypothetical protein